MEKQQKKESTNILLLRYAGLGMQMIVAMGLAVYAGLKLDGWLSFKTPLLVWVLPLLVLSAMLYKIIKESSGKENKIKHEKKI